MSYTYVTSITFFKIALVVLGWSPERLAIRQLDPSRFSQPISAVPHGFYVSHAPLLSGWWHPQASHTHKDVTQDFEGAQVH